MMRAVGIGVNSRMAELIETSLQLYWDDFNLRVANTAGDGLDLVVQEHPNLLLFCADFSDMSLTEAIMELRRFSKVPLMVLRSQGDEWEMVSALELGADDYLSLPCASRALMARIYALLRRAGVGMDQGREILAYTS